MASRSSGGRIAIGTTLIGTALALLAALHYYIANRLLLETDLASPWREAGIAALVILGLCLVAQPFAERLIRPPLARLVSWPASLWMGFAFLLLNLLAASDLLLWLGGGVARAAAGRSELVDSTASIRATFVVAIAFVAGGFALRSGLREPAFVRQEIALDRWPESLDGFRIVQLSDLHIGPILGRSFAQTLVSRVNERSPDLIAITGDLVDGGVAQLSDEVAPLADLTARHGVFFVTGNHDHYSGALSWCDRATELGMSVLRNRHVSIAHGKGAFDLVGVDDHRGSHIADDGREDLATALAGRDPSRPAVLLAHDPSTFKRACVLGIDLQLSGHTHGGQIWPFGYLVRLAIPFVAGRYRRNGTELYVSRGTGFWGPPMRLRAPAEITEIILRHGSKTSARTKQMNQIRGVENDDRME
jgi:predicted MPP superfamily phosphohydrolase